jgi:RNA polymerase sigma-70 factor (ECF subfamily)
MTRYDLMESVSMAFLLALEALTPAQRAVLILRDVFDYSTNETAEALEMSEANIKVTLHRARRTMDSYDKNRVSNFSQRGGELRDILQRFLSLLTIGDVQGVKKMLAADVVLVSDGGGEVNALAEPMYGREKVLRLIEKLYEANRDVTSTSLQNVNGEPTMLIDRSRVRSGHASFFTMHCELDETSQIRRFNFVFAPSKLAALTAPIERPVVSPLLSDQSRLLALIIGAAVLWCVESQMPLYGYEKHRLHRALPNIALTVLLSGGFCGTSSRFQHFVSRRYVKMR